MFRKGCETRPEVRTSLSRIGGTQGSGISFFSFSLKGKGSTECKYSVKAIQSSSYNIFAFPVAQQ